MPDTDPQSFSRVSLSLLHGEGELTLLDVAVSTGGLPADGVLAIAKRTLDGRHDVFVSHAVRRPELDLARRPCDFNLADLQVGLLIEEQLHRGRRLRHGRTVGRIRLLELGMRA